MIAAAEEEAIPRRLLLQRAAAGAGDRSPYIRYNIISDATRNIIHYIMM